MAMFAMPRGRGGKRRPTLCCCAFESHAASAEPVSTQPFTSDLRVGGANHWSATVNIALRLSSFAKQPTRKNIRRHHFAWGANQTTARAGATGIFAAAQAPVGLHPCERLASPRWIRLRPDSLRRPT